MKFYLIALDVMINGAEYLPGVSLRTFCSGLKPNENDGWFSMIYFSGEYVPGADSKINIKQ